jgi:hypothetical protein
VAGGSPAPAHPHPHPAHPQTQHPVINKRCEWLLKNLIFCWDSPISTRLFCCITCTFKHQSLNKI